MNVYIIQPLGRILRKVDIWQN